MGRARFGTDGVRGAANGDLSVELALAVGRAAARVLPEPVFLIGRDSRRSGPMLQAAVSAGLAAEGADVVDLGVLPTPGVAYLAERQGAPAAVISASHNPFADNGIKLFGPGGYKLDDEVEAALERHIDAALADPDGPPRRPTGRGVGELRADPGALATYADHLRATLEGRRLDGLTVVLDCANGAASTVAPEVFRSLGASVTTLCTEPDGTNINEGCGSTQPGRLAEAVVRAAADLGLAFDGDADRLVAVDHTGTVTDGDLLLALFALDLAERRQLVANTVAVTVMTNLGFRLTMAERGIAVRETPVGDRHILAALEGEGLVLGGEQSGHIVFRHLATTGDGTLTALALADLVLRRGKPLATLAEGLIERVPQVLVNVSVAQPSRLAEATEVWAAVAEVEAELGETGRVLLRPSGTEPVVRVMVEAPSALVAEKAAGRLCQVVAEVLGSQEPADSAAAH